LYRGNREKTTVSAGSKSDSLCYTSERVTREGKKILQHHPASLYIHFVCHRRIIHQAPIYTVSNGSGELASGPCSDCKNGAVRLENSPKTQSTSSYRAKPGPIPFNPRVLPGLARPIGSNLRFYVSGFTIHRRI